MQKKLTQKKSWNWAESVNKGKELVGKIKGCTIDLVRELYAAHEALSNSGYRSDLAISDGTCAHMSSGDSIDSNSVHSLKDYCEAIDIPYSTARRWLALYLPEEDRLMTKEELGVRLEERYQAARNLIAAHQGDQTWRPDDWCPAYERRYQQELQEMKLKEIAQRETFDALLGLPDRAMDLAFVDRLQTRIDDYMPGPEEFYDFAEKSEYSKVFAPKVPKVDQFKTYLLAKAAIDEFAPEVRAEVTRLVTTLLIKDATGGLKN